MDLRNKWAVHVVRTLIGLLMLVMGAMGLYFVIGGSIPEVPGTTDAVRAAEAGLMASGILIAAKLVEIVAGFLLLINFRPAFATLILAPITVGIMIYDLVLWRHVPSSLIPALVLLLANIYFGYVYWDKYKAVFEK